MKIESITGRSLSKRQAQIADAELKKIQAKYGRVTAQRIVDWARPRGNPLHKHFEWNSVAAAEKYRLEQARHLIHEVRVVVSVPSNAVPYTARAWVSAIDKLGRSYRPFVEVMSEKAGRDQLLVDAYRALEQLQQKYRELEELAPVFAAVEKVLARRRKKAA